MNSPSEDKKQQNQLQNLRQISVNDEIITPDQIIHEMQHHESNSQDEIIKKSSEVLIIQSLFLQKAKELGLDEDLSPDSNDAIEETIISRLIAKEVARKILPEGLTKTRLYMNGTLRSWVHYIDLRSANGTQKEHMEIAKACAEVISKIFPRIESQ